jgi:hypothetical protein
MSVVFLLYLMMLILHWAWGWSALALAAALLLFSIGIAVIFRFRVFACNLSGRSGDCVLLPLTIDRSLQAYRAVSSDDLDVFSAHRQGTVLHHGLAYLLRQRKIGFIIRLLLRGICILVLLRRVAFSVVGLGRSRGVGAACWP